VKRFPASVRGALEADHLQRLEELRAGYIRVRRKTLAIRLAVAFTAGGGPIVVLPWLPAAISTDVSTLALWFATLIGLGIGTIVPLQRFGLPRWS
jgi:hypothetical protein